MNNALRVPDPGKSNYIYRIFIILLVLLLLVTMCPITANAFAIEAGTAAVAGVVAYFCSVAGITFPTVGDMQDSVSAYLSDRTDSESIINNLLTDPTSGTTFVIGSAAAITVGNLINDIKNWFGYDGSSGGTVIIEGPSFIDAAGNTVHYIPDINAIDYYDLPYTVYTGTDLPPQYKDYSSADNYTYYYARNNTAGTELKLGYTLIGPLYEGANVGAYSANVIITASDYENWRWGLTPYTINDVIGLAICASHLIDGVPTTVTVYEPDTEIYPQAFLGYIDDATKASAITVPYIATGTDATVPFVEKLTNNDIPIDISNPYTDVQNPDTAAVPTTTQTGVLDDAGVDAGTGTETGDTTVDQLDLEGLESSGLGALFISKFPFSIPWDLAKAVGLLAAPAVTPYWSIDLYAPIAHRVGGSWDGDTTIEIDFSQFEILGQLCRWMSTILFVFALAAGTKRFIWTA